MALKIPINLLSLYDYHYASSFEQYLQNLKDAIPKIDTEDLYKVEPSLKDDQMAKTKHEHCVKCFKRFETKYELDNTCYVPKYVFYILFASFFYETHETIEDIDEIQNWESVFNIGYYDKLKSMIVPFIGDAEIRGKLISGIKRRIDRHISKISLVIEAETEATAEPEVIAESHRRIFPPDRLDDVTPTDIPDNVTLPVASIEARRNDAIQPFDMSEHHITPYTYLIANVPIDDNLYLRDNNSIGRLVNGGFGGFGGFVLGPKSDIHNGSYTAKQWFFRGYFFIDKVYHRGDAVFFNQNAGHVDVYVCLKDEISGTEPERCQYWINIQGKAAIKYISHIRERVLVENTNESRRSLMAFIEHIVGNGVS